MFAVHPSARLILLAVLFSLVIVGKFLFSDGSAPRVVGNFLELSYTVNVKLFKANVKLVPSLTVKVVE